MERSSEERSKEEPLEFSLERILTSCSCVTWSMTKLPATGYFLWGIIYKFEIRISKNSEQFESTLQSGSGTQSAGCLDLTLLNNV